MRGAAAIALVCVSLGLVFACTSYDAAPAPDADASPLAEAGTGDVAADAADAGSVTCTTALESDAAEDANCPGAPNVNLESSPANCGFCGHDCRSLATCATGMCSVGTVYPTTQPAFLGGIVGTQLFWILSSFTHSEVHAGSPDGKATDSTLVTLDDDGGWAAINGITVDDQRFYISGQGGVFYAPRTGGPPTLVQTYRNQINAMTQDATYLYWAADKNVVRWPKDNSSPPALFIQGPADASLVDWLAMAGTDLLWAEETTVTRIMRRSADGNTFKVVETAARATAITVAGPLVYWAEPNVIHRAPVDGSSPAEDVARWSTPAQAADVLVDGDHVYWLTHDSNYAIAIYVAPTCGGRVRTLDAFQDQLRSAAFDTQFLYWGGGAGVGRAAK
jgi:hypothetical protein